MSEFGDAGEALVDDAFASEEAESVVCCTDDESPGTLNDKPLAVEVPDERMSSIAANGSMSDATAIEEQNGVVAAIGNTKAIFKTDLLDGSLALEDDWPGF